MWVIRSATLWWGYLQPPPRGFNATCCDPGLLHPEPLPLWPATADPYLCKRYSNTQRQVWLSLYGVSGSWAHKILFEPSKRL